MIFFFLVAVSDMYFFFRGGEGGKGTRSLLATYFIA